MGPERSFLTECESPWVVCAALRGSRKVGLVEKNASGALKHPPEGSASVALKTSVTEIRDSEHFDLRGFEDGRLVTRLLSK